MKKTSRILLLLGASSLLPPSSASAAVISSTFAPGNPEGWSSVTLPGGSIGGGYAFFATSATFGNRLLWQNPAGAVGGLTVTTSADADGRGVQHDTALLRSPTFTLNGGNGSSVYPTVTAISFSLLGGTGTSTGPSGVTVLPGVAVNQPTGQYTSYLGVALRRVGDDAYLLWGNRSANAQSTNWQTISWDSTALAAATASDPAGTLYTLDFVDAAYGDWGWVAMDNVTFTTVPEASTALLGLFAVPLLASRRRTR
jgi:hypothetical protein